ncbi:MAG: universal stress protein [Thermoleophilia bacterium]|nr:universal stress protein [Thermoleophilia bacterium]
MAGAIVCGVDGSDHALAAVRIARGLAEDLGAPLVVVHALMGLKATIRYAGARSTNAPLTGQPDERERIAGTIIEGALGVAGEGATGIVENGSPWEVLEAVAAQEDARLIVVAARGQSSLRTALFGSVAQKLAAEATRPVLVVPERAEAEA